MQVFKILHDLSTSVPPSGVIVPCRGMTKRGTITSSINNRAALHELAVVLQQAVARLLSEQP